MKKKIVFILLAMVLVTPLYAADSEVQDLSAITSPATGDVLYVVDDPTGTPASRKITIGNLLGVANDLDSNGDVADDSHAHTTTSISGLDISDDTNLAVTAPITLTDDTVGITVAKDIVAAGTGMSGGADDVLPGADADVTITLTTSKDLVTSGTGLSGGEDDVFPGADADVTITLTTSKDIVAGAGLTGGEDDVLPGADADVTIAHSTANGYVHTPADGASAQILQYSSAGTSKWITVSGDATIADGGAVAVVDDSHNHIYSNIDETTSENWLSRVSDETGTGVWVFSTSPTLVTPTLGAAVATSLKDASGYYFGLTTKAFSFSITKPLSLDEADTLPVWVNRSGQTFNITAIYSNSDTDDVDFTLKEVTDHTDFTALTTIEAITIATDGTSVYYNDLTSGIDHTAIEDGHLIVFDNDATDDPDYINCTIVGYYN